MAVEFDVKDPAFQNDPHGTFQALRNQCPVHHSEKYGFYSVSRYADVKELLRNTTMWSSKFGPGMAYADPEAPGALVNVDPPEHDFQLKLVNKAFTRQSIDALEGPITDYINGLVADLAPRGECDLMRDFAMLIPLFVIARMLGVNHEDSLMFRGWVEKLTLGVFADGIPEEQMAAAGELATYFQREINQRRAKIAAGESLDDDLITRLLTAEVDGKRLEEGRIMGFISFLLIAGSGTTTMLICSTVDELLKHPDQLAKVSADPGLIPAAAEESMRFNAPVHGLFRTNNEDINLHGVDIPKESKVLCLFASANLDEDEFADPEAFNVERPASELRKQLGFGWGTHICTGAPLARMEARIALSAVFNAMPGLRRNGNAIQTEPNVLYGFDHLPVAWDI
ncbi:MAG: cytochrome P450 [Proteobacteria bacterium]|nr:cytochrome P450 [Pseudomonadota bacterium]